jgi:hypothetical protein
MGGYDQFSSLPFYALQFLYVSYVHLCCFICSHEVIQTVLSYCIMTFLMPVYAINISYLFVLILQSCCLYCYLFIFSCSIMLHVPCLYAYYIYMIHTFYILLFHIIMDIFVIMISMINHLLYVITIMLIYGINDMENVYISNRGCLPLLPYLMLSCAFRYHCIWCEPLHRESDSILLHGKGRGHRAASVAVTLRAYNLMVCLKPPNF